MRLVCGLIRVRSILDLLLGLIRVLGTLVADVGFSFVTYEGSFRFLLQASSNCRCRRRIVCDVMNDCQLVFSALLLLIVVGVILFRLVDHVCGEDVRFVVLSPLVLQGLHVCFLTLSFSRRSVIFLNWEVPVILFIARLCDSDPCGIVRLGLSIGVHKCSISQVIVPTFARLLTPSLLGLDFIHVDEVEHQLLLLLAFIDGSDG